MFYAEPATKNISRERSQPCKQMPQAENLFERVLTQTSNNKV